MSHGAATLSCLARSDGFGQTFEVWFVINRLLLTFAIQRPFATSAIGQQQCVLARATRRVSLFCVPDIAELRHVQNQDWRSIRAIELNNRRHPIAGSNLQKVERKLITFPDVYQKHVVGQAHFFQCNVDFPPIWGWPIVQINGVGQSLSEALSPRFRVRMRNSRADDSKWSNLDAPARSE